MSKTDRLLFLVASVCTVKVYSGFVSQDSVWVGDSPALDYLLRCGLVHRKHSGLSTDDIYSKKTLQTGISRLQKLMGVKQTGLLDDRVMSLVMRGNCLRKKERLRVKSAGGTGCSCLGLVDRQGGGECRGVYRGRRWCYVSPESTCQHSVSLGNVNWSYSPCPNRYHYT